MRFLVDAQLPPALARWLAAHGHEAEHVLDRHMETATNSAIWDFACLNDTVIVTKDEDFTQGKILAPASPVVVWIRLPNTRRRELLAWFETVLLDMVSAIERGETLVELV